MRRRDRETGREREKIKVWEFVPGLITELLGFFASLLEALPRSRTGVQQQAVGAPVFRGGGVFLFGPYEDGGGCCAGGGTALK